VAKAGLTAQRMVSSVLAGTSEAMGQWSGCGRRDGKSGSGGGSGFFACGALAESAALAFFLLSLDDFAADFDANLFCEGAEAGFAVFDDVAHAGARSNKAQLAKRQCRMVSFKPTMAPLRMMVCDFVLPLSRSLDPAHAGSRQAMVVIINMFGCAVWFDCPPSGQKHVGFPRRGPPGTISGR
jgi:hypothetical protein